MPIRNSFQNQNYNDMEFVQNTKSMDMQPQSPDEFNMMDGRSIRHPK